MFEDLIEEREALADKAQSGLSKRVSTLQATLWASLLESVLLEFETDTKGSIRFNSFNVRVAAKVGLVWASHLKQSGGLTGWVVDRLLDLFGLNTKYMREVAAVSDTLEARTRKLLFENLGWDLEKSEIIKDSWLESLTAQSEVKTRIINRINAALQSQVPLKKFREDFKTDFLDNKKGLGYLSRYYDQKTGDIYAAFDRSVQQVYREQLKLNYAIFSGTVTKPTKDSSGSRGFCLQRKQNLYDLKTIESWNNMNWKGKIEGQDVKVALGGHRCKDNLSWVSDEMAESLQKKGKVLNKLNPLPAGKTLQN